MTERAGLVLEREIDGRAELEADLADRLQAARAGTRCLAGAVHGTQYPEQVTHRVEREWIGARG